MSLIASLTPEQIAQLRAELESLTDAGRSPVRPRQLQDLRLPPTGTDPRPLFVWSAESPRDLPQGGFKAYPKLLWHIETGREVTVRDAEAEAQLGEAYTATPPGTVAEDPTERAAREFAQLSAEDQALVLEMQRQARLNRVNGLLASLTDAQATQAVHAKPAKKK